MAAAGSLAMLRRMAVSQGFLRSDASNDGDPGFKAIAKLTVLRYSSRPAWVARL